MPRRDLEPSGTFTAVMIAVLGAFAPAIPGCGGEVSTSEGTDGGAVTGSDAGTAVGTDAGGAQIDSGGAPAGDAAVARDGDGAPRVDAGRPGSARVPIMISAGNYERYRDALLPHRPFLVYAWATDPAIRGYDGEIAILSRIDDTDVAEMVMYSSHATLARILTPSHAAELRGLGVTVIGYNTEGMMTPESEMNALTSSDPGVNSAARFATIATGAGFEVLWGPIRGGLDAISDGAITAMVTSGVGGIGMQEQKHIESAPPYEAPTAACVPSRVAAFHTTVDRYRRLAGGRAMHIDAQIMPSRCQNGDDYARRVCGTDGGEYFHCLQFIEEIAPDLDSLAIWASGPEDPPDMVGLVAAIRGRGI